ncbi:zinc finger, CCHC-type containing protein [Tanacetum coccineum]
MTAAAMSVVYVLTTPILEDGENATMDQIIKKNKRDNNDYVCRGMSDPLIDIYQNVKSGKEICIEESLRALDSGKPKGNNVVGPQWLNIVNDNIALAFMSTSKLNDSILWHARLGHVHFKRMQDMSKDGLILAFDMDTENDLYDLHATSSLENKKYFVTFIDDASRSSKKLKVDGTIRKFKARLVIQGFKQKSGIDYFDTYAPVARISTIRLLIAMASIHNMIIHQMDVKTAFLNGELDEEVYMNQPQSFIISSNENKVCKLIKSLSGLKHTPKQWHQKFDVVVLSNGYLLNQADKYVYSKFNESGKEVIICLYVDDMLIFGTDQVQVDLAKEFLSSRFYMKDMGEAHVILGIRIKYESNRIEISQSHFIEKVFNYFDCTPVSTPMDTSEKLMPNSGQTLSQLEYSRVIGCLMYVMTCTRLGIAFVVGKLSNYTSNPEGYTDASWISNTEDNSSTSGWVFLLADSKEAEWLKNLLLKISLWSKPIAPISIRCDSAAILAKAYSQMYNGKSRHLGIRHCMIHELITNGVISIEFVRSQQNLADYLTKRLARDLVIKSTEGM